MQIDTWKTVKIDLWEYDVNVYREDDVTNIVLYPIKTEMVTGRYVKQTDTDNEVLSIAVYGDGRVFVDGEQINGPKKVEVTNDMG